MSDAFVDHPGRSTRAASKGAIIRRWRDVLPSRERLAGPTSLSNMLISLVTGKNYAVALPHFSVSIVARG
ncbi:hypothetical protein, partial [Sinorhizobium sp. 6-117]|uniref:hypothetical protein n=1 Tax=Sinorhizobium sp. 6-117 TaxID=3049090 RepID=UPI0024C3A879